MFSVVCKLYDLQTELSALRSLRIFIQLLEPPRQIRTTAINKYRDIINELPPPDSPTVEESNRYMQERYLPANRSRLLTSRLLQLYHDIFTSAEADEPYIWRDQSSYYCAHSTLDKVILNNQSNFLTFELCHSAVHRRRYVIIVESY